MNGTKWYHLRRVRLTREYCAGTIAGFGLGIVMMAWATGLNIIHPGWTWVVIPGFALISIGSYVALHVQRGRADTPGKER